jgi:hypothetical protein
MSFCQLQSPAPDVMSPDFSVILSNFNFSTAAAMDSVTSMQEIFELDGECNVILQGRIGQVNAVLFQHHSYWYQTGWIILCHSTFSHSLYLSVLMPVYCHACE